MLCDVAIQGVCLFLLYKHLFNEAVIMDLLLHVAQISCVIFLFCCARRNESLLWTAVDSLNEVIVIFFK